MNLLQPWDFEDDSIEEIVMISILEHFSKKEAEFVISEIKRVLKLHSRIIVDIPDIKGQVEKYYDIHLEESLLLEINRVGDFIDLVKSKLK